MAGQALAMMPWFPRDFLAATRGWPLLSRAIYRELLDAQWELGALPEDTDELARIVGATDKEFATAWKRVSAKFVPADGGGLLNPRLEEHRAKALKIRERRAAGAEIANAKRDAQRPAQRDSERNAERDAERDGQRAHPSPSPSPSTSLRSVPPPPPKGEGTGKPENHGWGSAPDGVDPQAWRDWSAYRRGRPKAQTVSLSANFLRELPAEEQREAVAQSIRNGWTGLFAVKRGVVSGRQPPGLTPDAEAWVPEEIRNAGH